MNVWQNCSVWPIQSSNSTTGHQKGDPLADDGDDSGDNGDNGDNDFLRKWRKNGANKNNSGGGSSKDRLLISFPPYLYYCVIDWSFGSVCSALSVDDDDDDDGTNAAKWPVRRRKQPEQQLQRVARVLPDEDERRRKWLQIVKQSYS